jgi:DNA-binding GntR family transcriptional regulator
MSSLKDAVLAIGETLSVKHIDRVEQRISARMVDAQSAKALGTPMRSPCLLIVRRHFDYKGKLLLAAVNQHRAADFVYVMDLKRSK